MDPPRSDFDSPKMPFDSSVRVIWRQNQSTGFVPNLHADGCDAQGRLRGRPTYGN
jgi:hypothetical protein